VPSVTLNGDPSTLPEGSTVADAVRAAGVAPGGRGVAAALDGEVVPHGEWQSTPLSEGAEVEVLQAVGGG
jgi:sulfur carrier protein